MDALNGWNNFYVIVGSAAGALIGLQFVVLTLIANRPPLRAADAGAAFATPTVVHFGVVLFLAAIVCVPWQGMRILSVVWALLGLGGIVYTIRVVRHMRVQTAYRPVFEDWVFHVVLPLAAYAMLIGSAYWAHSDAKPAPFIVAAATLLLLFVGIHNAWDAVTYHVLAVSAVICWWTQ
jgi:hypothetical protein